MASSLLSVISYLALVGFSSQQNDPGKVTCYSWTGQQFDNNTICPGSNICCNTADLCDPNRFCQANNQTIVPACAVFPWNNCANICQYDPGTGFLPRAVQCDDGSYCCDNDPQCCADNEGVVLNGLGAIVSTDGGLAALTTSTSSTSSSTTSASLTTTSSVLSTTTNLPTSAQTVAVGATETPLANVASASTLSGGAIVGIAAGVVIFIVAIGAILFWIGRRRGIRDAWAAQVDDPSAPMQKLQKEQHVSAQFLHGTPVYESQSQEKPVFLVEPKGFPRSLQELSAGTPRMNN